MHVPEVHEGLGEIHLLDVREDDEWDAGHIEGAQHIPMGELVQRQDEIPKDETIVCVCRTGGRSGAVAGALSDAGYDAHNLEGGMQSWAAAGHGVTAGDGGPGRVI